VSIALKRCTCRRTRRYTVKLAIKARIFVGGVAFSLFLRDESVAEKFVPTEEVLGESW